MIFLTFFAILSSCFVLKVAALTKCKDYDVDNYRSERFAGVEVWVLRASLSPNDKDITVKFKVDNGDTNRISVTITNGTQITEKDAYHIPNFHGLIADYNKNTKVAVVAKMLFGNTGSSKIFCFVVCDSTSPDDVAVLRCYVTENATFDDVKKLVSDSGLDLNGRVLLDPKSSG